MADYRNIVIVTYTPVKDDAGLSGKVIGAIYGNYVPFECTVDYGEMHDKDVPIVDPPTWRNTGKVAWVEWAHCIAGVGDADTIKMLVTYYKDGRAPTVKVVA